VLKRSWAGEVRNVSLLVAISVNGEGYRQFLGIVEGAKEDKAGWSAFLSHLKERGLHGVELIVSDACLGLVESAAEYFPGARWQRCMVHFYRNVFSHVPAGKLGDVALMLKAIHAKEDLPAEHADACRRLRAVRTPRAVPLKFPMWAGKAGLAAGMSILSGSIERLMPSLAAQSSAKRRAAGSFFRVWAKRPSGEPGFLSSAAIPIEK